MVKPYPKSKRSRRFRLDPTLVEALDAHVRTQGIGAEDLLFHYDAIGAHASQRTSAGASRDTEQDQHLGRTQPNVAGRSYSHGTLSAYTAGACRCRHCKRAFADYRSDRRTAGLDQPRKTRTGPDTDGHLPRNHWRTQIWTPTCTKADLSPAPACTTCATPTPHGSSPAAPTSNSQRTTRPPIHHHHREVPPHSPHRRFHRAQRPQPRTPRGSDTTLKATRRQHLDNEPGCTSAPYRCARSAAGRPRASIRAARPPQFAPTACGPTR